MRTDPVQTEKRREKSRTLLCQHEVGVAYARSSQGYAPPGDGCFSSYPGSNPSKDASAYMARPDVEHRRGPRKEK